MMFRNNVRPERLSDRLDAAYYGTETLELVDKVRCLDNRVLGDALSDLRRHPMCYGFEQKTSKAQGLIPYLKGEDLGESFIVQPGSYISDRHWENFQKAQCNLNDLIMSVRGAIGKTSVNATNRALCSPNTIVLAPADSTDSYYLSAFLNSRIGQSLIGREVSGTVQDTITEECIRRICIFLPDRMAQVFIGDKVRQAERLRTHGDEEQAIAILALECLLSKKVSEAELFAIVLNAQGLDSISLRSKLKLELGDELSMPISCRTSRVAYDELTDRLDAGFYRPDFLENAKVLASSELLLERIEALCEKCNCGATPIDVEYEEDGQGLVRTSDVRPNRFQEKTVLRTRRLNVEIRSPVAAIAGDVLYTMSGTIGYAAVIPETTEIFSFSNTIARARLTPPNNPWFVAAFLNSSIGYKQSLRLTSGGIQGHVMPNPFKRLWVPVPNPQIQDFIGGKLQLADKVTRVSDRLVTSAKLLIEALVEQKIKEYELIHAQTRLEQGDDSADRAILSRLFAGGWDATETRPLFPDLDVYYETLRMVEREPTEVATK